MTETRIIVFGCVGKKTDSPRPTPIQELYRGDLWNKRMRWLRATGRTLDYVFSAQYGLVEADREVVTYDLTIKQRRRGPDYKRWKRVLANRLAGILDKRGPVILELHAGTDYFVELQDALDAAKRREDIVCTAHPGVTIHRPLEGMEAEAAHAG